MENNGFLLGCPVPCEAVEKLHDKITRLEVILERLESLVLDHETRIRKVETSVTKITVYVSAAATLGGVFASLATALILKGLGG